MGIINLSLNLLYYIILFLKILFALKEYDNSWSKLRHRVSEEVLEPLTSYLKPFPDVKVKIMFKKIH